MLKTTIGEAIDGYIDTTDHYLYLYRDEDTIFYIGQSDSPIDRLMGHLGRDFPWMIDRLGTVILENMPQSRNWTMEMYTLKDCIEIMRSSPSFDFYIENIENALLRKMLVSTTEERLIFFGRPCLNVAHNRNKTRLPEKYQPKGKIANEGVKLGQED